MNSNSPTYNNPDIPGHWKKITAFFMAGQAVSLFGSAVVEFAIIWHITLSTKSGFIMTISTLCVFIPRVLISPFAGVWADRYNRKKMIMIPDGGIAFVTLLLAIIFLLRYQEIWLIFLVLGIRSIGTGIQTPAVSAIIPQMVPADKLMKVNGINGSLQSTIMLLAPAVSGVLLGHIPLGMIFFIDVITALIAIGILLVIKIAPHIRVRDESKKGYYKELKQGLVYTRRNLFVREMLILYAFYFFLISPAAFLSPLAIARTFGDEVWRLTANEIAFSVGMMLGGAIIAWWGGFRNRIKTISLSCTVVGISISMLGIPNFYIFLSMIFSMGIVISFFSSAEMTLFQEKVEQNMQGRIFGLIQLVSNAAMPVGMILFGPMGDVVKIEWIFIGSGILVTLLGIRTFLNKRLKNAAEP